MQDSVLVFSWSKFSEDASGRRQTTPPSRVEVRFAADDNGTRLTIVHSAVGDDRVRADFAAGWERALPNLEAAVQLLAN